MKERPILFSAQMVRAILDGSKTQTRRAVRKQFAQDAVPAEVPATSPEGWQISGHSGLWWDDAGACIDDAIRCPYGQPGDRLWVRETFHTVDGQRAFYRADYAHEPKGDKEHGIFWTPSIHMPRWASRIILEVTGVRVERLQDISGRDAYAEGVIESYAPIPVGATWEQTVGDASRSAFAALWNSINGPRSWRENPWVWVIEFEVVK